MCAKRLAPLIFLVLAGGCATARYDPYDPSTYALGACNPAAVRTVAVAGGGNLEHSTAGHRSLALSEAEFKEADCADLRD